MVNLNGKWGLIDSKGNAVIPCVYDSMSDLYNGWFEVSRDDQWGYVNMQGVYAGSYIEYQEKKAAQNSQQ